ncbi:hypothetical protein BJ170DRAFT_312152 [Xylariales sp. AK1849]|nr:hypothetical protein BJ170DRAFT_312152 [Xylariales sp. AK1849]
MMASPQGVLSMLNALSRTTTSSGSLSQPTSPHLVSGAVHRQLRSCLPPSSVADTPPPQPRPWVWQCCCCNATYRLGCTQRCLTCSHAYCTPVTPPRQNKKRRVDKNGQYITCRAEFDYNGWNAWGAWRRDVLGEGIGQQEREKKFLERTSDDWVHCDSPSQCHHKRQELIRKIKNGLYDIGEEDSDSDGETGICTHLASKPPSPDGELEMNEAVEIEGSEVEKTWRKRADGRSSSPAVDSRVFSEEQLYSLLGEDDAMMPIHFESSGSALTVRNHPEADWNDWSSDSDSDDDEELVDADGNLVRPKTRNPASEDEEEGLVSWAKAANTFLAGKIDLN